MRMASNDEKSIESQSCERRAESVWCRRVSGMTGTHDSVIGTRSEIAVGRFLSQVPTRFKPAEGPAVLCGVLLDVDESSGRSLAVERLQLKETEEIAAPGADEDGE